MGPYQVRQAIDFAIPKPAEDAWITAMDVDVVDAPGGQQVPIDRLMLHHVVFANLGRTLGERRDGTCSTFTVARFDVDAAGASASASTPPARSGRGWRSHRGTPTRATGTTRGCSPGC